MGLATTNWCRILQASTVPVFRTCLSRQVVHSVFANGTFKPLNVCNGNCSLQYHIVSRFGPRSEVFQPYESQVMPSVNPPALSTTSPTQLVDAFSVIVSPCGFYNMYI